ncbi:MAG: hypothetical protein ACREPM_18930, partial [Gemmatimonadaceae bacterium]
GAAVKFFNFGVGAPGVNFYANTQKVTAISSTSCQPPNDTTAVCKTNGVESTTGTAYGAAGSGGFYGEISPGQTTLAGKIAATTDNGLAIATVSTTLDDGKFYSYYISGIYSTATKTVDAFVVEDPIPTTIDPTQAYVRYVNAVSNSQAMTLYAKSTTTGTELALGGSIAYKAAGTFTAVPGGVYDLNTRTAGSSTNVITRTAVSFVAGRVYTVSSRGDMVSTVTATKPALDNTANR